MKYSIVIPCYNEEGNIEKIIEAFMSLTLLEGNELELILVQNGSKDQTFLKMQKYSNGLDFIKIVNVAVNQGYGYGIKQGLKQATGKYVGWLHADLQTAPDELVTAIGKLKQLNYPDNVLLKGLRKKRPVLDQFFTLGMALYETCLLGCGLYDINAQPTLLSRDLYEKWSEIAPDDFSLDLYAYFIAKKNHCTLIRWPVVQYSRTAGESSWNTGINARVKLIKRTLKFSENLKKSFLQE